MLRALVELGKRLEKDGRLPPPGFYYYKEPIRWRVRLRPNGFLLTPIDHDVARPFSGRTSGIQPHLLADEAGYSLGVELDPKGKPDKRAAEKHAAFIGLLEEFLDWPELNDPDLRNEVVLLIEGLKGGWLLSDSNLGKVTSKDWVEFVPETGPLQDQPLFMHPQSRAFWAKKLAELAAPKNGPIKGECAVCRTPDVELVGRIPLGVKLVGNSPLTSFNQPAFPSYHAGAAPEKSSHIGLCFDCADTASRAFNYLSQSNDHRITLISDRNKRDALTNQIALYWVKAPQPIEAGEKSFNAADLSALLSGILSGAKRSEDTEQPRPTLAQLQQLLALPWKPLGAAVGLDDYSFYLAVLSPNIGRIALREWISTSLADVKRHLTAFLRSTSITSPWGDRIEPRPLADLLRALDTPNPNLLRGLLRTAYLGQSPPKGFLQAATYRMRNVKVLQESKEVWNLWSLAATIKLILFYGKKEGERMERLDPQRNTQAYLSGRLLAVLEEAQKRAQGFKINRTLVERFYGAASTAPAATFGMLLRTSSVSHLQKAGSLNPLVEDILSSLDTAGGFPKTLTLEQQAEFALGFYHQRADFRSGYGKKDQEEDDE